MRFNRTLAQHGSERQPEGRDKFKRDREDEIETQRGLIEPKPRHEPRQQLRLRIAVTPCPGLPEFKEFGLQFRDLLKKMVGFDAGCELRPDVKNLLAEGARCFDGYVFATV
ncbi:MAG: hypothetical protein JSS20_17105 [Proteobacteria bacterium]|nr:hypothetical protein [Pseudomonadota bacterium]